MNKTLTSAELGELEKLIVPMTKAEKLRHLAQMARAHSRPFHIFDRLEYYAPQDRARLEHPHSIFALAAQDPKLQQAGLKGQTVGEAERFFDLTKEDLHLFSCNCGGEISNRNMADLIEAIAARS